MWMSSLQYILLSLWWRKCPCHFVWSFLRCFPTTVFGFPFPLLPFTFACIIIFVISVHLNLQTRPKTDSFLFFIGHKSSLEVPISWRIFLFGLLSFHLFLKRRLKNHICADSIFFSFSRPSVLCVITVPWPGISEVLLAGLCSCLCLGKTIKDSNRPISPIVFVTSQTYLARCPVVDLDAPHGCLSYIGQVEARAHSQHLTDRSHGWFVVVAFVPGDVAEEVYLAWSCATRPVRVDVIPRLG